MKNSILLAGNQAPLALVYMCRSASLRKRLCLTVFGVTISPLLSLQHAQAAGPVMPTGGQYAAGAGQILSSGTSGLTINQTSAAGVINWRTFSIGAGGSVQFNNGSGATLNRVTGNNLSQIDGQLTGTGSIYLINQNGVLVGPGGKVLTGGNFVASTRDIPNSQFMQGGTLTAKGTSAGVVSNEGTIVSQNGNAVLIGSAVSNSGTISAPNGTAVLAAGNEVVMAPVNGPAGIYVANTASGDVTNTGAIKAAAAALESAGGNVYTLAGNRTGLVQATGTTKINGQVWLSAPQGQANVDGTVTAVNADGSGGTVIANGASVHVAGTARVSASGTKGGTVLIGVSAPGGVNEAGSTTIDSGARISATGSDNGTLDGGHIETSGKTLSIGAASITAGEGGTWLLDPTDLTIDSTAATNIESALNAGTSVTEQTTASGVSGAGTQASGAGDINIDSAITWNNAAAKLSVLAYHAINVNAPVSGAGKVLMSAANGDLTIGAGASISGDTGVTLGTGANFINDAGSGGVFGGSGGWLIYSTRRDEDEDDGLTPDFIQYNAGVFPASGTGATAPDASGNGFLYSDAPTLALSFNGGAVSKTYDGTTAAMLDASNVTATGLVNGDTADFTGAYGSANAGTNIAVSVTGVTAYNGAIPVYGYTITNPTLTANVGTITPKLLSVTIVGDPTKVYDGTTTATLTNANYDITGMVGSDSFTVDQPSSVAYASASASTSTGTSVIDASFTNTNFTPVGSTQLSNYTFPASITGYGTILQAPLEITGLQAEDMVYSGSADDTLNTSKVGIYGVVSGDDVTLDSTSASATFTAGPNVGNNLAVSVSGFTLGGAQAADYQIVAPTGLTADITPAPLSISGISATNIVYNGTTVDPLSGTATLNGVVNDDAITLSSSGAEGTFASANVGTGISVSVSGYSISGANAADYTLSQPSGLSANITPAPVSVIISGTPTKTYDGTATAVVSSGDYTISGFVSGQGASITQTADAQYSSVNAGNGLTVTASLTPSDFQADNSSTLLTNYDLTTTATGTGAITPAPLDVSITNNPNKTYDGTTTATLTASDYAVTGFVGSDSATIGQTVGTYASANAGPEGVTADLTASDYGFTTGLASNYSLPTEATGSGTIYPKPVSETLDGTITGDPTKTYDGTTEIEVPTSDITLTGFVGSDGATFNDTQLDGNFASANAGTQNVTVPLSASDLTGTGGTNLGNYTITDAYGTGTITPKPLTGSIVNNPTKVYDGTNTADLTSDDFSLTGLVSGQGINVQEVPGTYNSANTTATTVTATLASANYTPNSGTLLSNYSLPTTISGAASITPAPLVITGVSADNITYNQGTTDTLSDSGAALYGLVPGDAVSLSTAGATASFASPTAGDNLPVTVSGFALTGSATLVADYDLIQPSGLTADILPAPLSILNVTAENKNYDDTTVDTLNTSSAALSGVLGGDDVTLVTSGATASFGQTDVGTGLAVSDSGFSIVGAKAVDYSLAQPSGLTADIDKAPITVTITGNPTKVYDGSPAVTVTGEDYTISGFAQGQGASIPQTATAVFTNPDAGSEPIDATLVTSDFQAASGTDLANYALPTNVTGEGTITPAPLTAQIIGDPTKIYDTTTSATLASDNYSLSGFIGADGATVNQPDGTYASATAGSEGVSSDLVSSDFTATGTTDLSNYSLPTIATGNGTIDPYTLTASLGGTVTKVYDSTDTATLGAQNYALSSTLDGQTVTLNDPTLGSYAEPDVGSGINVTVTGLSLEGADAADYTLAANTINADIGTITPDPLTLESVTKVYDSGTGLPTSSSAYALGNSNGGIYSGDAVSLNISGLTGTYTSKDVATAIDVDVSGLTLTGAQADDYSIASSVTNDPIGTITPAPLTVSGISVLTKTYDTTTAATLTGTPELNGVYNGDDVDVNAAATTGTFADPNAGNNIPVTAASGDYTISGPDAEDYTLSQPAGLTGDITPAALQLTLSGVTKVYDGTDALPASNSDYALSGVYSSDQGSVAVDAAGLTGSYADSNVNSGIDVTIGNITLTGAKAEDYQLASSTVSGDVGEIDPARLTYNATAADQVYGNGNTSFTGNVTGFVDGQTLADATTGTASFNSTTSATSDVGDYAIEGSGLSADHGNYIFAQNAGNATALTITPYTLTASLTGTVDKTYDGTAAATLGAGNYGLSSTVNGDSISLNDPAVGSYATPNAGSGIDVTASGLTLSGAKAEDYQLASSTVSGDVGEIDPARLTYNATAADQVYGNGNTSFTGNVTGFVDGQTLADATTGTASFNSTTSATSDVGDYAIEGSGLSADHGNYIFAQNAGNATALTITPYTLTASLTGTVDKTYDGTAAATLGAGNYGLSSTVNGDSISLNDPAVGSYATPNAGSGIGVTASGLTLSGAKAEDYQLASSTVSGDVGEIDPARLTYNATAADQVYGNGNTSFTGNVTGFVDGQTLADATTGTASFNSTTSATSDVGDYAIEGSGLSADHGNYIFAQNAGNATALTITPYTLTASLTGTVDKTYDGTAAATLGAGNYGLSSTVNGDSISLNDPAVGSYATPNAGSGIDVTASGLTLSGAKAEDYQLASSTVSGDVGEIDPARLTYNATAADQVYGNGNTSFTGNVTGFVDGQTLADATTGTASFNSTTSATSDVGDYAIEGSGLSADHGNYIFAQNAGNATALTITPYTLTASLTGTVDKTYDGTAAATLGAGNYGLSSTVNGDSISLNDPAVGSYATPNAGSGIDVTASGLTLSGAKAEDYQLASSTVSGDVGEIDPARLTYNATAADQVYGNGNTSFTGNVTGFVDGQTLADATTGTASFNSTTSATSDVGDYAIEGAGLSADHGNYIFAQNAGNATALTITPYTLTASLTGTVDKTYDGTAAATLGAGNYGLSSTVNGDSISLNDPAVGSYATPNAGSGIDVTASGLTLSGAKAEDYQLASSTVSGDVGEIDPARLTYNATAADQVYGNGNTSFTGNVTGFVDGQTLADATTGTASFNSTTSATSDVGDYAIEGSGLSADHGNYIFAQNAGNATALTITPYTLTASLTGTVDKTYDGTAAATLGAGNYGLSSTVNGDSISLNDPAAGSYATPNAGSGIGVTASGLTLSGAKAEDYQLASSTVSGDVGEIDPAVLTASVIGNPTRIYNGNTSASLTPDNFQLTGFVTGQGAAVTQTVGTYATGNPGPQSILANIKGDILANDGTSLLNYALPDSATGQGTIIAANLDDAIAGTYIGPASSASVVMSAYAGNLPVINIPFPAPAGLFARGGGIFGSLPTVITVQNGTSLTDGDIGTTTGQPLMISPEEILLQGGMDKTWDLVLPPNQPVSKSTLIDEPIK